MTIFKKLERIRKKRGSVAIALIDPDFKYHKKIKTMISLINKSDFDAIFVGGSRISDDEFNVRLKIIKNNTKLPVIIFPGSSKQISKYADALLYLSLISGRNPNYLIEEHIKSAPVIHKFALETIPTAYILLDGGIKSSVEIISNTQPIPMENHKIVLAHALAGQYLGKSFIFLETGSGAKKHATTKLSLCILISSSSASHLVLA